MLELCPEFVYTNSCSVTGNKGGHDGNMISKVNESAEDYLETILILSKKFPVVRAIDIAVETGYKKSSVSVAMKNLRERKHIEVDSKGFITLTSEGLAIAESVYERHVLIADKLVSLGVPEEIAVKDACRIEHVLSPESYEAIKKFVTKSE